MAKTDKQLSFFLKNKKKFFAVIIFLVILLFLQLVGFFKVVFYSVVVKNNCLGLISSTTQASLRLPNCYQALQPLKADVQGWRQAVLAGPENPYFNNWADFFSASEKILLDLTSLSEIHHRIAAQPKGLSREALTANWQEISRYTADLQLASVVLNKSLTNLSWPFPLISKLLGGRLKMFYSSVEIIGSLDEDLKFFNWVSGQDKPKVYLVFFQNNAELRPTGGFWGSYGLLYVNQGKITSFAVDDIYHLDDKTLKTTPQIPPWQLTQYLKVDRWFMRDLNWWPDFGVSANLAAKFYSFLSGTQPVDGLIAITPGLIADLLKKYGPLEIDGQTYNADNFLAKTQYQVSVAYKDQNISSWDRKDFLNQLVGQLFNKITLTKKPATWQDWKEEYDFWQKVTAEKNVLLYSADQSIQDYLVKNNWAGTIRPTSGDYLMVVDANLASLKTDPEIERQLTHKVEAKAGSFLVTTEIKYIHHGNFNWRTTNYQTYVRVYVPQGSWLESAEVVSNVGREVVTDKVNFTQDQNKTVLGYFMFIPPQQTKTLVLTYKLPVDIPADYSLLAQKQPGAGWQSLALEYSGLKKIVASDWPAKFNIADNIFIGARINFVKDLIVKITY